MNRIQIFDVELTSLRRLCSAIGFTRRHSLFLLQRFMLFCSLLFTTVRCSPFFSTIHCWFLCLELLLLPFIVTKVHHQGWNRAYLLDRRFHHHINLGKLNIVLSSSHILRLGLCSSLCSWNDKQCILDHCSFYR